MTIVIESTPDVKWWQVDHDHSCCSKRETCGKCVRGILCASCNKALGLLKESPIVLQAALEYITNKGLIYEQSLTGINRVTTGT